MGKHFGELATIRGIIYYKISQHEQRAFAGAISKGLPNAFRRLFEAAIKIGPPSIIAYLVYEAGEHEHHMINRKKPADYANDK